MRDSQDGREAQRQEAGELRRSLGEGAKECEALRRSNEELRVAVKKAESERIRWGAAGAGGSPGSFSEPVLHMGSRPWKLTSPARFWGKITQSGSLCP